MIGQLTSNQYYGGLNRRFDKRIRLLHRFGFRYRIDKIGTETFGVLYRKNPFNPHREQCILASELLHSHNRVFRDELRAVLRIA